MKNILMILVLGILVCTLSACETMKGFGKDVEDAGEWVAAVADEGPGIPDGEKVSVFERFKRREKKGVLGSGLGLAIAQRIVYLHSGTICAEDNPGGGSCFVVRLPRPS